MTVASDLQSMERKSWLPRISIFDGFSMAVAAGIVFLILYPAAIMLYRVFFPQGWLDLSAFGTVLAAPWLGTTLLNTVIVVISAGTLAVITASIFAWLNERTDARLGAIGDILPIIPLLVPAVAMAIGWIFLATPGAGFINGFLAATLGRIGIPLQVSVTSWAGVIFVYTLYFIPYVYLIVSSAFRNVDPALEEASRLSGASTWTTLRKISLPAIKPAIFGAALLVAIVGFSVYSIPVVIANRAGIDILSVRILRSLTFEYPPRTDQAVVLTLFMLVAVAAIWLVQRRVSRAGRFATIGGKSARHIVVELGPWKWVARALMIAYVSCTSVLPLLALLVVSLQPFWQANINPSTFTLGNYYNVLIERPITRVGFQHSLGLGLVGGFVAIFLGALMAIYAKSAPGVVGRTVDGVTKLPAALSHIVIGVGFLLAFSGPPFNLSGTLFLLFLCYIVLHMPEASIAANAAVSQVGDDLLEASSVAGASQGRTFRKVLLPLVLPGLVSGWALLFVLMAGELTASALLAGTRNPVVGFVILDIWEQGTFGALAALAFSFTLITSTIVLIATRLSRRGFHAR